MGFDVKKNLMKIKGKDYLPVAQRLVWFREEHPDYGIETRPLELKIEDNYAVFHARITDETGRVLAEATKMETKSGFGDFVEKAETGAVGRALGYLGYGTQFEPGFDEGDERLADTPQEPKPTQADKPVQNGKGERERLNAAIHAIGAGKGLSHDNISLLAREVVKRAKGREIGSMTEMTEPELVAFKKYLDGGTKEALQQAVAKITPPEPAPAGEDYGDPFADELKEAPVA
jgi:hypothetical protein